MSSNNGAEASADRRLVGLDELAATDRELVGAKAANLAIARRAGLPAYGGFVLTTVGTSQLEGRDALRSAGPTGSLGEAWAALSDHGRVALAVRSSSVIEDSTTSSMAGRFVSILHVVGWAGFVDAVADVLASAATTEIADAPMAVLVQPMGSARLGGVMFGLDPLTGDRSALRISATLGLPDKIVDGSATGAQLVLSRRGRLRSQSGPVPAGLGRSPRKALARLARRAAAVFGGPQDIEWLIDDDGRLRLLQSRPITAAAVPPAHSHLLGPAPVAETFPDPLRPLERDLWEPPLDEGIREALRISGALSKTVLAGRFVVDVGGRVAVDLEALGVVARRPGVLHWLDPRPPARRLIAAWRVGRLRAAFPQIAHELVVDVDGHLAEVPDPTGLGDGQLLAVLRGSHRTLAALHAYEALAGIFLGHGSSDAATSGAAVALATLARGRREGLADEEITARYPVVLALVPPSIFGDRRLPPVQNAASPAGAGDDTALAREALRLRLRWVHELTAVVSEELGRRLAARGQIARPEQIRDHDLASVERLVAEPHITSAPPPAEEPTVSLPAFFRLAADGSVIADVGHSAGGHLGVSPGRARAPITHDPSDAAGKVLVVPALAPSLAGAIAVARAIVAETGSPLSHLAILAREYHVPAVVGVAGAVARLADGTEVLVDGTTGDVTELDDREPAASEDPTGRSAPTESSGPSGSSGELLAAARRQP